MKKFLVLAAVVALSASPVLAGATKVLPNQSPFEHGQGVENTRNGGGSVAQSSSREAREKSNDREKAAAGN